MLRRIISSLFLTVGLLVLVTILAAAQEPGQEGNQTDMGTPMATVETEVTPVSDLPLSGDLPLAGAQMGTCPMMGGTGMTASGSMSGMNMSGMSGMSGMQGMSGMAGMQGMSNMPGMQGMSGVNMAGMNGAMPYYPVPWYNNPWLILGWILVTLVGIALLIGAVLGIRWIVRSFGPSQPVNIS